MEFTDLLAYKKGFALAMKIFEISKIFPKKKNIRSQIKYEGLRGRFAVTLLKHIENEITPNTLSVNLVIVMVKTVKL